MNKMFLCALATAAWIAGPGITGAAEDPKPATPTAPAVQPANRPPGGGAGGRGGAQRADALKRMTEQLGLTQAQQDKLKPLLAEQAKKARELRDDTSLTQEQRREKAIALRTENQKKLKESKILTDEQAKKWETIQAENRNRGQGRGPRAGGAPAGAGAGTGAGAGADKKN